MQPQPPDQSIAQVTVTRQPGGPTGAATAAAAAAAQVAAASGNWCESMLAPCACSCPIVHFKLCSGALRRRIFSGAGMKGRMTMRPVCFRPLCLNMFYYIHPKMHSMIKRHAAACFMHSGQYVLLYNKTTCCRVPT